MKEQQENKLAVMPVGRLLFSLAVPAIAAQIVNLLYNLVDRIYIGHLPGENNIALTGVGLAFPVITPQIGYLLIHTKMINRSP